MTASLGAQTLSHATCLPTAHPPSVPVLEAVVEIEDNVLSVLLFTGGSLQHRDPFIPSEQHKGATTGSVIQLSVYVSNNMLLCISQSLKNPTAIYPFIYLLRKRLQDCVAI